MWVFIALVLIDAFANLVVFGTDKSNYFNWCVNTAFNSLPQDTQLSNGVDYYNCNKLWQDEFNFGLVCVFLMVTVYVIYTYILKIFYLTNLYIYMYMHSHIGLHVFILIAIN